MTHFMRIFEMRVLTRKFSAALLLGFLLVFSAGMSFGDARADGFQRIKTQAEFLSLVGKSDLKNLGVTLQVRPNGSIRGNAFGRSVTGAWTWKDGYFCRSMSWGSTEFKLNCQTVGLMANTLRFTADQGKGDTADLRIR
jgi:hypothetical protein